MLVSTPKKKKRARVSSLCPVVESQDSVLILLKRVRPFLHPPTQLDDSDDEDDDEGATSDASLPIIDETKISEGKGNKKRKHSRSNVPWASGRCFVALGINECTRLLGKWAAGRLSSLVCPEQQCIQYLLSIIQSKPTLKRTISDREK